MIWFVRLESILKPFFVKNISCAEAGREFQFDTNSTRCKVILEQQFCIQWQCKRDEDQYHRQNAIPYNTVTCVNNLQTRTQTKTSRSIIKTIIKQLATKKCKRCTYRKKVIKKCPNAEVKAPWCVIRQSIWYMYCFDHVVSRVPKHYKYPQCMDTTHTWASIGNAP